jgi:8-oxo-dGTP pyrophosphatase MutT (NUDIX family)
LVLMRDSPGGAPPQVLMVERSAGADFAAGAYVFPGGAVEPGDATPCALRLSPALSPAQAREVMDDAGSDLEALSYFVAAIRETFEESGILLARPAGAQMPAPAEHQRAPLAEARARMNRGQLAFLDWLQAWGWVLSTERLVYFAHWVTPEASPKRFDTRFFLAPAPEGMEAAHDAKEVVSHRWITPAEALRAAKEGRIHMIEPTVVNLERLAAYPSTGAALAALRGRPVTRVMPKMVPGAAGRPVIIFPWDPDYENA